MQVGIPTLLEIENIEDLAKICVENNACFIELNMNLPEYQLEKIDAEKLLCILKKYGIYYTIHLDENLNVCDFNEKVANAYKETVFETIFLAKKINAPIINMHMSYGVYFTMPDQKIYLFDKYSKEYIGGLEKFCEECEKIIDNDDIKICVENTKWHDKKFLINGIEKMIQYPSFGLTFDIGHDYCTGGLDEEFITKNKDKLFHMHIHDATKNKNHLTLGEGEIDLGKYFKLAQKRNCRAVIEVKTIEGLKKSLDRIKTIEW